MSEYSIDECGITQDGLRVRAVTDAKCSEVVVTNDLKPKDDILFSQSLKDHAIAIEIGKTIAKHGTSIYQYWVRCSRSA